MGIEYRIGTDIRKIERLPGPGVNISDILAPGSGIGAPLKELDSEKALEYFKHLDSVAATIKSSGARRIPRPTPIEFPHHSELIDSIPRLAEVYAGFLKVFGVNFEYWAEKFVDGDLTDLNPQERAELDETLCTILDDAKLYELTRL